MTTADRHPADPPKTRTTAGKAGTAGTPRPTPARARILAQSAFEAGTLLRNGEQLLVSIVLPVLALLALTLTNSPDLGAEAQIDIAVPGVLALAILSTAFTGQAISTGFDRRYGVLRLLGVSPLGRDGLLAGKACAVLLVEVLQFGVLAVAGLALGWRPAFLGFLPAAVFWLLGTWVFVALALLLAGWMRAEAVLAVANLLWVMLLAVGGVVVPRHLAPEPFSMIIGALPSAALGDGLRVAFLNGGFDAGAALVLLAWGLAATAACLRVFRWSD